MHAEEARDGVVEVEPRHVDIGAGVAAARLVDLHIRDGEHHLLIVHVAEPGLERIVGAEDIDGVVAAGDDRLGREAEAGG